MKLDFEYGHGMMSAELPEWTDVFIPGETVPDPPCLPQDWDSLYAATLDSIRHPIGMPPLKELAGPGKTVVFVIPDIVKGGVQPTSHRKVSIRACLDELYAAGVEKKDILLLISNGLHPRATVPEMRTILGEQLFNEFYPTGQITSHDSEDYDHMVDLGFTASGDHVLMNKYVFDADIPILIGHTQGNPYGGYSGGYKHCATGITHWRSIAGHHIPRVMHAPDFVPVSTHSVMRSKFDEQGMLMEEKMGHKFFCCDAVLDTKSRQIEINSGWAKEMQPVSWKMADKRTYVHWAEKKYDVMVFGMPTNFHYGPGMGKLLLDKFLGSPYAVVRHTAFRLAESLNGPEFKKILMAAVHDSFEFIRRIAVTRMGRVGDEDFIPLLIDAYIEDHHSARVIFQISQSLECFDRDKVRAAIEKRFAQADFCNAENYKALLLECLDDETAPDGTPSDLYNITSSESGGWRKHYITYLKNRPLNQFVRQFTEILCDEQEDESVRVLMAESLAWFNLSCNKQLIIDACAQLLDKGGMSEELTREVRRAYSRLTSKK